jgi:hypothetical protein
VIICIVVFLEFDWVKLEACQLLWRWKLVGDRLKFVIVVKSSSACIWVLFLFSRGLRTTWE